MENIPPDIICNIVIVEKCVNDPRLYMKHNYNLPHNHFGRFFSEFADQFPSIEKSIIEELHYITLDPQLQIGLVNKSRYPIIYLSHKPFTNK